MSNIQTLPLEDIMGDRFGRYSKIYHSGAGPSRYP